MHQLIIIIIKRLYEAKNLSSREINNHSEKVFFGDHEMVEKNLKASLVKLGRNRSKYNLKNDYMLLSHNMEMHVRFFTSYTSIRSNSSLVKSIYSLISP